VTVKEKLSVPADTSSVTVETVNVERPRHFAIGTGDWHQWQSEPRRRKRRWTQITAPQALLMSDLVCLSLPAVWDPTHVPGIGATALISCLLFWSADLYRPRLQALVLDEVPALLSRLLAAAGVVATVSALRHPSLAVSTYLELAAAAMVLTLTGRAIVNFAIRKARRRGLVQHKSIIIGTGPVADRLTVTLAAVPDYGLAVVGYLADHSAPGSAVDVSPYLGPIESLRSRIDETDAAVVLVSDQGFAEHELSMIARQAFWNDCDIFMVPRLYEVSGQRWMSEMIGSIPVGRLGRNGRRGIQWKFKRIFDIFVSSVALLALSPLLGVCALAVRIDGGPGILFRQIRVGRDGDPFEIVKFRTLQPADDAESGTKWSIHNDGRVTRVGRFLRRTSLDELPQLWTILCGDMTIVGPRPERPHFVAKFSAQEPTYFFRHRVPAGLTGLAQVNGMRGDTSIRERSNFDNYYIENWSFWLDMKVILRTFSEVLSGNGG
jgi:exopolysaccharide biosynthesis polyprenyl glycosylphosphotransferase